MLLLATALLAPGATVAQTPGTGNGLELDTLSFAELQRLIASQDSVRVRGSFGEVVIPRPTTTPDSLVDGTTLGPRVGLSDVTRIQVRGGASGPGALVGAGIGFAGGLAAGAALSSSLCSDGGCSNAGGGTPVIALGAPGAGALVGALIGPPPRKWHTVYEARLKLSRVRPGGG